jgi:hypothetical protein
MKKATRKKVTPKKPQIRLPRGSGRIDDTSTPGGTPTATPTATPDSKSRDCFGVAVAGERPAYYGQVSESRCIELLSNAGLEGGTWGGTPVTTAKKRSRRKKGA